MQINDFSLSIVIPVFNEEKNIVQLYKETARVLDSLKIPYEIIFIDDGSADRSSDILRDIAGKDELFKAIFLSRNFGQTAALMSGIDSAIGNVIIFMDGDLQNDPKDIPMLVDGIKKGYDVVSGWRKTRKDNLLSRVLPSLIANKLISMLSGVRLRDYGCTLKAYRAEVLKDVKLYGEMHRFIPIYAAWNGAKIMEVAVNHQPRRYGKSKYNMWRTVKVLLDMITMLFMAYYRTKPIYIFGGSGILSILLSFICLIMLVYNKFVLGISMIQSPLLILSALLVIVGTQSILMGLLAEMQMRTYYESLNKPIYRIKERINI